MSENIMPRRRSVGEQGQSVARNMLNPRSKLRAREPIGRSFGLVRGKFPSRKMGRMIHWESQLERDAAYLFEFSPGVASYREQPLKVHYGMDGVTRRYTPDFELTLTTGEIVFVEVKPEEKLQEPENAKRFNHIKAHFKRHEQPFRILTEHDIRQSELLENLRMLMRYRDKLQSRFQRIEFAKKLIGPDSISLADAVTLLGDIGTVWVLIDERLLFCDLKKLVNSQTIFSTAFQESSNEKLYF